ncbi:MAG: hypothetical protein M1335_02730 [Chloroflexi bacterium]|nr:hypothetical protein [Chloroflexota bacterium]
MDKIVIVDGAYADFPHSVPSSTDGTLEWIKERRKTDPRIELIECAEAWADEAAKRSAYFVGRDGDWYLHVDADERIVSTDLRPIATLRERLATTVLDGFHLDVETNLAGGKMSLGERYLRIIRHLPGLRYTTTHYMVETDDRFLILDSAKLGLGALYSGFSITHFPSLRAAERQGDKQAYYKKMLVKEVARLRDRIIDAWSQGRRAEHRFLVDQYITRVAMVDDVAKRDLMIDPKYLPYADLSSEVLEAITAVVVPNS